MREGEEQREAAEEPNVGTAEARPVRSYRSFPPAAPIRSRRQMDGLISRSST